MIAAVLQAGNETIGNASADVVSGFGDMSGIMPPLVIVLYIVGALYRVTEGHNE